MKRTMTYRDITFKILGTSLVLLLFLLFLGSCTKENLSQCGVVITFIHTNQNQVECFPDDLQKINLYVFDDKGLFVDEYVATDIASQKEYTMQLSLSPGTYTIVSWGNLSEAYQLAPLIIGQSTLEEATLSLRRENNEVRQPLTSLYHGSLAKMQVTGDGSIHKTIELINNVNTLHITLKGLPVATNETPQSAAARFPLHVTDNNGDYKFDNTLATQTPLTYIPTYTVTGKDIVIETTTLRLFEEGITTLTLEADKTKSTDPTDPMVWNLITYILKNDNIKNQQGLDHCDYYDIVFEIDQATHTTGTITINGWLVYTIEGDI